MWRKQRPCTVITVERSKFCTPYGCLFNIAHVHAHVHAVDKNVTITIFISMDLLNESPNLFYRWWSFMRILCAFCRLAKKWKRANVPVSGHRMRIQLLFQVFGCCYCCGDCQLLIEALEVAHWNIIAKNCENVNLLNPAPGIKKSQKKIPDFEKILHKKKIRKFES